MTNRSHPVTLGIGCGIVGIFTLLYLLYETHQQLQDYRTRLYITEQKFISISKQFESLYEYKDRLEKSFASLREQKAALTVDDTSVKEELVELKTTYSKQIQSIQEELDNCRRREEIQILGPSHSNSNSNLKNVQSQKVPYNTEQEQQDQNHISRLINYNNNDINNNPKMPNQVKKIKEQILPLNDPNDDTAGNLII